MHLRVTGAGALSLIAYSLDHGFSLFPVASPINLSSVPLGQEILVKWWMRNEQQSVLISTDATGAFFLLAFARVYYTNSLPMR